MAEKKEKRTVKKMYKMPERITKGEILTDIAKVSWVVGNSIGVGGFGEIYVAAKSTEPAKLLYAIKIEPRENGPLFCERTVYINIGKKDDIEQFMQSRKLKYMGIPVFHGFGSHKFKNIDYRFIVIDKLGKDVSSLFGKNGRIPYATILKIGIQILHVLEYMHHKGYVHCDVKGANLLLGEAKGKENQVHVVDFGLACKYASVFTPNPKKAHNGTPEYTSRDAHLGVMTRRGDLEVLAYNLVHWTTGHLPWEKLTNCQEIQAKKESFMKNPEKLLAACYKTETPQAAIKDFLTYVCKLEPLAEPDYKKLEDILSRDLQKLKSASDVLEFNSVEKSKSPAKKPRAPRTKPIVDDTSPQEEEQEQPKRKRTKRVFSDTDTNGKDDHVLRKSPRSKKSTTEVKRSWRDCPTVMNGAAQPAQKKSQKK